MEVLKGNIRPNHIHIMVRGPAYLSVSKMAQYLKGKSSYRLQREFPELRKQYWGAAFVEARIFLRNGRGSDRAADQGVYRKSNRGAGDI
jgi:putative transposase